MTVVNSFNTASTYVGSLQASEMNSPYSVGTALPISYSYGVISGTELKIGRLYKVYIVDREDGELLDENTVYAISEEEAKFKSGAYNLVSEMGLDLSDVTILTQVIGYVTLKEKE